MLFSTVFHAKCISYEWKMPYFFFAIKRWKTWNIRPKNSKCMRIKSSDCISSAHRCVLIHFDCIYLHIVISTSVMLIFCFTRFLLFVGKWCFGFCSIQQWPSNPNSSAFHKMYFIRWNRITLLRAMCWKCFMKLQCCEQQIFYAF